MPSDFTPGEDKLLEEIAVKIRDLRAFLDKYELPQDTSRLDGWYHFLNIMKLTLGNFNNDVSFVATLLAKLYLGKRFPGLDFDASSKSQSSPGLDIDVRSRDGKRVIGEVKTVDPYNQKDFGANQRTSFLKDFSKLALAAADHKYLFLTEPRAFAVVKAKYEKQLTGVTVVCLSDSTEFTV
jgi:hypothetical protein